MSSPIEQVHEAISTFNPFSLRFVDQQHIWGESFPDVPEINSHISDAIFAAITLVETEQILSTGIIVTGERGLGKTQVLSRVRHHLQEKGGAFFVYMGNYGDLSRLKFEFQKTLVTSLNKVGSQGVMQWQELAAKIFFETQGGIDCSIKELVDRQFRELLIQAPDFVEVLTSNICNQKPELDNPYLVKAILWTLVPTHSPYAISWLTGQELTESKANELGLPNNKSDRKDIESFDITCQLLDLVGKYTATVICFDELDSLDCNPLNGSTRALEVASLAKDLRNRVKRAVTILAMYEETLKTQIKLMAQAEAVLDRIANKVLGLEFLNCDKALLLVSRRLKAFWERIETIPPDIFYPFEEEDVKIFIGNDKVTARRVFDWCNENWKVPAILPDVPPLGKLKPLNPVKTPYQNELEGVKSSFNELIENNIAIAYALSYGFRSLIDKTIENVKVTSLDWIDNEARKADQGYLHFRICGVENGNEVKIGVSVIQESTGNFITAALKRLIDYEKFKFTRGCLVRSKTINQNSKVANECVKKLINVQGGEWVKFKKDELIPLLAISNLIFNQEKYELSPEQIYEYIEEQELTINNPLLLEILSDPSGHQPDGLIDEDMPISITKVKESDQEILSAP